jgi:hypothetical protein
MAVGCIVVVLEQQWLQFLRNNLGIPPQVVCPRSALVASYCGTAAFAATRVVAYKWEASSRAAVTVAEGQRTGQTLRTIWPCGSPRRLLLAFGPFQAGLPQASVAFGCRGLC